VTARGLAKLRKLPRLEYVYMSDVLAMQPGAPAAIAALRGLKALMLDGAMLQGFDAGLFPRVIPSVAIFRRDNPDIIPRSSLHDLVPYDVEWRGPKWAEELGGTGNFEVFNRIVKLRFGPRATDADLEAVQRLPSIEYVYIEEPSPTASGLKSLSRAMSLRKLDLRTSRLDVEDATAIAASKQIAELTIWGADSGLRVPAAAIREITSMPNLRNILLVYLKAEPGALRLLAGLPSVLYINIGHTNATDDDVIALTASKTLRAIDAHNSYASPITLRRINELLKARTSKAQPVPAARSNCHSPPQFISLNGKR
jgi:hypothetical protein